MKSSLEIAQEAELIPIEQIAEACGLLARRDRALRPLQGQDRLERDRAARRPARRQAGLRGGHDADQGGRGQDDDARRAHAGHGPHRQARGRVPARAVARPGVRHQGRRGRRRHDADRADGGPQPPLHRRHPRDRRGEQPARRDARRLDPARQPAQDRPAARRLAAGAGHERPRAAPDLDRPRRPRERLPARVGLRHHRRVGGDGDPGRVARTCRTCARGSAGSPSRTPSTAASRSRPRTSARPARWRCCSRTRSSRTSCRRSRASRA